MLSNSSALRTKMNTCAPLEGSGTELHRTLNCIKGVWDFAVQGGAVGTLNLLDDMGNDCILPSDAIVVNGTIDVLTGMTSAGGAGTVALGLNTNVDIKAAVDADTLSGLVATIPVGTAATSVKLTAQRQLKLTIAVEALTAGKIAVFLQYYAG